MCILLCCLLCCHTLLCILQLFFQNFATIITLGFWGTLAQAGLLSVFSMAALQLLGLAKGQQVAIALALGAICSCSDTVGILQVGGCPLNHSYE